MEQKHTYELVTPVPERRCPELLKSLYHARSKRPDLGRCSRLLSEVASEEEEPCCRSDGVRPTGSIADPLIDLGGEVGNGGKSDEEEGDGKKDPGDGEDGDGRTHPEESVPDKGEDEEDLPEGKTKKEGGVSEERRSGMSENEDEHSRARRAQDPSGSLIRRGGSFGTWREGREGQKEVSEKIRRAKESRVSKLTKSPIASVHIPG